MLELLPILIIAAVATLFGTVLLFVAAKLKDSYLKNTIASRESLKEQGEAYECGLLGAEKKSKPISVRYYLVAILFILFDIEVLYMYPWALVYKDLLETDALFIFSEMMIFVFILFFGLFYIWKSDGLKWE